jgi:hypothetical protein
MRYEWTDGPHLSILLVPLGDILYAAEIYKLDDGDFWFDVYMGEHNTDYGRDATRDGAKRLAEAALTELIGKE